MRSQWMRRGVTSRLLPLVTLLLVAASVGCDQPSGSEPEPRQSAPTGAQSAAEPTDLRLKDAGGGILAKLKPKDGKYKVYDGADQLLGKVRIKQDRVVLKDPNDRELWKIKRKDDGGAEIEDAATGARLYRLKLADGTWKFRDAGDATLAKCKPKSNAGFEMRDVDGATIAKVKVRDGRLAFETEWSDPVGVGSSFPGMECLNLC